MWLAPRTGNSEDKLNILLKVKLHNFKQSNICQVKTNSRATRSTQVDIKHLTLFASLFVLWLRENLRKEIVLERLANAMKIRLECNKNKCLNKLSANVQQNSVPSIFNLIFNEFEQLQAIAIEIYYNFL